MQIENQPLYTFNESAAQLHVTARTLRKWRREGKLAVIRIANSRRGLRIPLSEIQRLQTAEIGVPRLLLGWRNHD